MANVDNLNFSVIINDADFDARCAAIEKRANELNTNLSNILQIDKVVGDSKAVENLKKQIEVLIKQNDILKKGNEATSQIAAEMANKINEANAKIAEIQKQKAEEIEKAVEEEKAAMADEASSLNAVIRLYKQMEEIKNRASVRQMAGKWGMTAEDTNLLDEYSAKYDRLMEKVSKRAEKDESFAALKEEAEAIAQAEAELQKRNMAEKEFINILRERLQIQAKMNDANNEYWSKDRQGIDNSAEAKAYQDYKIQLDELDAALVRIKLQYSELGEISNKAFDIQDIGRALDYLNKMEKTAAGIEKKDLTSFNKQLKEYVSLEKQIAKLETDLNVRKVSNKNADYTNAENKKLQDHIAKQQKLRAELDKLIQRYPQLKAVFDQTFNTARLEAAVEAERRIARETERVTREKERQNKAIQAGIRHTANMTTEAKKLTMETGKVTKYWNQFKNVLGGATSIYAMKTILSNMMDITGEFELQRTTLRAILQDANKADVIFEKIKGLALVSPFNFKELISYTKQLSAFSIPANELYDTTKMLADLSAGLGVEMGRLILAVGQVRSAAVLRGQELRQFTESGIPLLEALRQEFERLGETGITTGQVFDKISNRLVPFQMVKNVLTEMTQEGGKFYNMQEVQSETLKGKLSNLKDAYQMMFNEIGESQSGLMKGTVDALREMMKNWEQVGKDIIALIAAFGLYKVAMAGVNAVLKASVTAERLLATTQVASISAMSKKNLTMAVLNKTLINNIKQLRIVKAFSNPYALITAGVVALGFAMYKLITYQNSYEKTLSSIGKAQAKYNADLATERAKLDANLIKLRSLTEGTEEYEKLKSRLLLTYDEYLTDIEKETIKTQGLANSYEILSGAIANYNKEKFYTSEGNKIDETFSSMLEDTDKQIQKILTSKKNGIAAYYSKIVMDIVQGTKSIESVQDKSIKNKLKEILFAEDMRTGLSNFDKWKSAIDYAVNYSQEAKKKLDEAFSFYDTGNSNKTEVALQEYQKKVQAYYKNKFFPMIDKLTKEQEEKLSSQPFWASDVKNNEGGIAYAKTLKEQFDKITNDLKQSEMLSAQTVEDYKAQLATIKEIDKIFNGAILRDTSEKKGGKTEKNPYEDEIQALKLEYDLLKKVQSAYEDLRNAGFGDEKISKFFSDTLGADFKGLDFASQITTITDSLRGLGEEGEKAADVIMNSAKKVDISEETKKMIDGVQQATERLKRLYDEFDSYIIEGNGITFDFSKILKESSKAITKIEAERKRSLEDLNTKKILLDEQAYQKEEKLIKNIYDTQIANQKKVTSEKIKELGKRYGQNTVKDNTKIKTKDYGDLSLGQIRTSIYELNQLLSMTDSQIAGLLSDEDRKKLKEAGLSLQDFIDAYREYLRLKEQDNETEAFKKVIKSAKKTTQYISTLSSSLANLGKANEKNGIDEIAYGLDKMVEATDIILDSLEEMTGVFGEVTDEAADLADSISKSADWVTMIVKIVVFAGKMLMDTLAKQDEYAIRYQQAMAQVNTELARYRYEANLAAGVDTLFGEDSVQKLKNYSGEISRLEKEIKKWSNAVKDILPLEDSMFFGWQQNSKMLEELRKKGIEIFDENGLLNSNFEEYLKMMEASGWDYAGGYDELIEIIKEYNEALEGLKESIQGVFGELSSNIADSWLDAWDEMGRITEDSAKNIDNIVNDLGRDIAKSLIQNVALSPILAQYEDELYNIYKKYGTSGNEQEFIDSLGLWSGSLKDAIQMGTDSANMILQSLEEAGVYDRSLTEGSDTLKSSIQGITEETASRLANLINGIYSEVFRQGAIFDNMDINVSAILSKMNGSVSENTYQDYLMQIQANTYDTAQNTHKMLERIDSVMASTGGTGGQGIKVYLQ